MGGDRWSSLIGLAAPLLAWLDSEPTKNKEHHRYRLVDLGTLGGPGSSCQLYGGAGPFFPASSILNGAGRVAAVGETTIPNLFEGCQVRLHGVLSHTGDAPTEPRSASRQRRDWFSGAVPRLRHGSSFAYWITDSGMVVGQSENNKLDPLTGCPRRCWPSHGRAGKIVNLGTLGRKPERGGSGESSRRHRGRGPRIRPVDAFSRTESPYQCGFLVLRVLEHSRAPSCGVNGRIGTWKLWGARAALRSS